MTHAFREHPRAYTFAAISATVLIAGSAYTFWPHTPPAMPETMDQVQALLDSRAYARLTREEKRPYVQRVSELMRASDREQRRSVFESDQSRQAMRDMFQQMMLDRAKAFALADAATRQKMLEEDRARMARFAGRRPRGEGQEGGERTGGERGDRSDRPERTEEERAERQRERENQIEEWVNTGNGQEWALIREYFQQVRPRR